MAERWDYGRYYGRVIDGPSRGLYAMSTKMFKTTNISKTLLGWKVDITNKFGKSNIYFVPPSAFQVCTREEYLTAQVIKS